MIVSTAAELEKEIPDSNSTNSINENKNGNDTIKSSNDNDTNITNNKDNKITEETMENDKMSIDMHSVQRDNKFAERYSDARNKLN